MERSALQVIHEFRTVTSDLCNCGHQRARRQHMLACACDSLSSVRGARQTLSLPAPNAGNPPRSAHARFARDTHCELLPQWKAVWRRERPVVARTALGGSAKHSPLDSGVSTRDAGDAERQKRRRLWYLAIKPPMYSVCIVPVLVAAAAAYNDAGALLLKRTGVLLLGSICIIAWLNLSNDAFDAAMGIDGDKAESVVNLTGSRFWVLWTANAFLVAGGSMLWRVATSAGDARIGWMLAAAIAMGYMYQGPPFRLSFKGLGEPITFITFGPLATSAFYLAHVAKQTTRGMLVSASAAAASVVVGLTTAAILFCSHFHQMAGDRAAGKKSPIVRLGSTHRGLQVLRWLVALTYGFAYAAVACRWLPLTCAVTLPMSVFPARDMLKFCEEKHKIPALIRPLKLHTIKWHSAVGIALTVGLIANRSIPTPHLVT